MPTLRFESSMEDSQPLSVESFSYTWLVNRNHPPLDSPNCSFRLSFDGASFIEMDPNLTPSKRFLVNKDFDFNVPKIQPHVTLVHADKLISNGILVPLMSYSNSNSIPASPLSSSTREDVCFQKSRSFSLSKCNKLHKTIIQKYMDLVRPLWHRLRRGRSGSSRVQGVDDNRGAGNSKTSGVCWGARCCDSESSIHEAVVHCKKTIGMD